MRLPIACVALLSFWVANAEESNFQGEFTLKATAPIEGVPLAKEYGIVVKGGKATIAYSEGGKDLRAEGTVTLTIHNGIDPETKHPTMFSGFIRVEFMKPGWVRDKFVTRFDLPFTAPPAEKAPKVTFASEVAVEMLWLDLLADGLTRYSDPMSIRIKRPYTATVTKNPIP